MKTYKYYTVYKIQNMVNGKIYIGIHATDYPDDGYMGSGILIRRAVKKYGIENFTKTLLYIFNNPDEMIMMETIIVNEHFCTRNDTYNITPGGLGGSNIKSCGTLTVKDAEGHYSRVSIDDPRYQSGELVSAATGTVNVKDMDGNAFNVSVTDPRYVSGELVHTASGTVGVRDANGNCFRVLLNDPRYLSGELIHIVKGLSRTTGSFSGRKHSSETRRKLSEIAKSRCKLQGNAQKDTVWIYNDILKLSKKIKRDELETFINNGWIKGRRIKFL